MSIVHRFETVAIEICNRQRVAGATAPITLGRGLFFKEGAIREPGEKIAPRGEPGKVQVSPIK
jgi:hypothetical protein